MAELIPTASEAEWLEARRQGITASEIPVIMGLSPWSSPYALYHQKLGILPSDVDSAVMERGRVLEPYIAGKFAAAHPEFWATGNGKALWRHSERPWQLATPDQLVHPLIEVNRCTCGADLQMHYGHEPHCGQEIDAPVAVAEFKTASSMDEWGEPGTDEIPVHYRAQVLWQMDVMRVHVAYVDVLDVPRWEIREYVVQHDESPVIEYPHLPGQLASGICRACDDVDLVLKEAQAFLDRIERQDPPDVDWRPATLGALKALHPSVTDEDAIVGDRLAANYKAAARNEKHWAERKRLYEARIREQMGSARRAFTAVGGEPVARRDVYTVREHVRRESTVDKLVIVPPKKEKKHVSPDSE